MKYDGRLFEFNRNVKRSVISVCRFVVVDVVDVDDLTERLPYHRWGATALEPPPVGLNREQNMNQGANGLQQRGTPTAVGQHSLQMGRGD